MNQGLRATKRHRKTLLINDEAIIEKSSEKSSKKYVLLDDEEMNESYKQEKEDESWAFKHSNLTPRGEENGFFKQDNIAESQDMQVENVPTEESAEDLVQFPDNLGRTTIYVNSGHLYKRKFERTYKPYIEKKMHKKFAKIKAICYV